MACCEVQTLRRNAGARLKRGLHAAPIGVMLLVLLITAEAFAQTHDFTLNGTAISLQDSSIDLGVLFAAMRFNRASNVWNVDVSVTNQSTHPLQGPFVLLIDSFAGTTGPQQPDGLDGNGKAFFNLSSLTVNGALPAAARSATRTLTLGISSGTPTLVTRRFSAVPTAAYTLATTRTLNDAGLPLPNVQVVETGPLGIITNYTDPVFGSVTLGQTPGSHTWKFCAPGYLPVWRQQTLNNNDVAVIPNPRLPRRGTNNATLTPISGGTISNSSGTIQVNFSPGAFNQTTTGALTVLSGQALPGLLPMGWSPLQSFTLELGLEPTQPGTATLTLLDSVRTTEACAIARWNGSTLQWDVLQLNSGNGNSNLTMSLPGSGSYLIAVADAAPLSPPAPQIGQTLLPSTAAAPDPATLHAVGSVQPNSSPASLAPELVTGTATVLVTNPAGPLPSGLILQGNVREQYALTDHTSRHPPQYETFFTGYQRPGGAPGLQFSFPLRPLLLFGPDDLDQATVTMDVLPNAPFTGGVLDTNGGIVAVGPISILAGAGDLGSRQAVQLRTIDPTNFVDFNGSGSPLTISNVLAAFELSVADVAPGRHLVAQFGPAPTNGVFVLARVLYDHGLYGLQPVERLVSDALGRVSTAENFTSNSLPGITSTGQYLLLQLSSPQALLTGVARNASGQPSAGLPVTVANQPWLAFSSGDGSYRLLAPTGAVQVAVTDLNTGDTGLSSVIVTNGQSVAAGDVAVLAGGPSVISVTPTNGAASVSRVSPIIVTFSKPINPATLLGAGLQLIGSNAVPVAASVSLNLKNTIATLLPTEQLDPLTVFTVLLSTNVSDLAGRSLAGPTSFTFSTESDLLDRAAAQLIIYEPTNGVAPVYGTPGSADPNSAVILVNETSGQTATVLSLADGSFTNFITADVEDFISATLVNQNGTQTRLPASRQVFRDGSIGLFNGGGTVSVAGEGGDFQLIIPPGTVQTKTVFKLDPLPLAAVTNGLANPPVAAQVLAGFQISIKNLDMNGDTDVSLPVDPTRIQIPDGSAPEDGAYALCMVRQLEGGGVAYQVVDKLKYANGRLHSNTAPFQGFGQAFADAIANNPLGVAGVALNPIGAVYSAEFTVLLLGSRPVTVTGKVGLCPAPPGHACIEEELDPYFQGLSLLAGNLGGFAGALGGAAGNTGSAANGVLTASRRALPGAFVTLSLPLTSSALQGRLQPGIAYATSDSHGIYVLVLPFADGGYILSATHPRYSERLAIPLRPAFDYQLGQGAVNKNFTFQVPLPSDDVPRIDMSHAPPFPPLNQSATLIVDAIHPNIPNIILVKDGIEPPGAANLSEVQITGQVQTQISPNQMRLQATISTTATNPFTLRLKATAVASSPNTPTSIDYHRIPFGFAASSPTNQPIQSDPLDKTGPQIERTDPLPQGILGFGQPITIYFSEPVDAAVAQESSQFTLTDLGGGTAPASPLLRLSPDQTRLDISFPLLQPGKDYRLTIPADIKDIAGNALLLPPTVQGSNFKLVFHTSTVSTTSLPGVSQGGGVAINGNYAYVLDRTGSGRLLVYDIQTPSQPNLVSDTVQFIGFPRDLVVLPPWPHVRTKSGSPQTNTFLAVVGGNLGTESTSGGPAGQNDVNVYFQGQYLRVLDISDPAHPQRVLGAGLTLRPDAVTKIRWDPPTLAFLELGSDFQQVGLIDLQEMFIGFDATPDEIAAFPLFGIKGIDADGDGSYVSPGDRLPTPPHTPNEFFGRGRSYLPPLNFGARLWQDFDFQRRGNYVGVVFKQGAELDAAGNPTGQTLPPGYTTLALGEDIDAPSATVIFPLGAIPKRVFGLLDVDVSTNDTPDIRNLALVTLSPDADQVSKVFVIDITQPTAPVITNRIKLPVGFDLGLAQSIVLRPNRQLGLATTTDMLILDERLLLVPAATADAIAPAIVGIVPGAGSGNISLARNLAGVNAVASGGRNQLVQEPPDIRFVRIPFAKMVDASKLGTDPNLRQQVFSNITETLFVGPARFGTNGGAVSSLDPPDPTNHYYVLMRAPGGAGPQVDLGIQSLNAGGYPLRNKGRGFPPVRAASAKAASLIQQTPRSGCDADYGALTAYRLSNDPKDPFYDVYLSKPFALTYERMSTADLQHLKSLCDREIVWSDSFLQAFIDPSMSANAVLGPFAAKSSTDSGGGGDVFLVPQAAVVAESFPATFIPGPNPPPLSSAEKLPGTFGTISAQNGEFRHETIDIELPSRRMPIVFERAMGGQDLYEGPFGYGWDFNYHQHLTELRPELFTGNHRIMLVVRAVESDSTKAAAGDVLWHTGRGRLVLYKNMGTNAPPGIDGDPLLDELHWSGKILTFYLPASPESGIFDPLFEFKDGQFARLTPDGRQYWFDHAGKLMKIYDRYTKNYHKLEYNPRGDLIKITDATFDNDVRYLEIGYYRFSGDSEFNPNLDVITDNIFTAGKIARLHDYTGRKIDFEYSQNGVLKRRLGFNASSANGGDPDGRVTTEYLYADDCSGLEGIVAGGTDPSAQLFAVQVPTDTGLVSGSGNGAGGTVTISPPTQNDAAKVGGSSTAITGPDSAKTTYNFDAHGFPSQISYSGSGADKATMKIQYGPYGLLTRVDYPLGNSTSYSYDTNNALLRSRGNLLSIVEDPGTRPGNVLTRTMPAPYERRYNLPSGAMTDFNLKSVNFTLRNDGKDIEHVTYENAGTHDYIYDADYGQLQSETTPEGIVIAPHYNADGFKDSEKHGSVSIGFGYDGSTAAKLGLPTSVNLPTGDPIQNIQYDDRLLLLQFKRGAYAERRGYDRNGNLKHFERDLGGGRTYKEDRTYNQFNFLQQVTINDAEVNGSATPLITQFQSSAQDGWRVRKIILPGNRTKQFDYDHLGNIIKMTLGSYVEDYVYDLQGNLASIKQGGVETRAYGYDGQDRVISVTNHIDQGDEVTTIDYYGNGELKDLTVDGPNFGRLREIHVSGIDGLSRVRHKTVIGSNGSADFQIDYTSAGSGGSLTVTGPRDAQTITYDAAGRTTGISDGRASRAITPDGSGNPLQIVSTESGATYTTSYQYDTLDHRTSESIGGTQVMGITPNTDGTPAEITDGRGNKTTQTFSVLGEIMSSTRLSGVQFVYQHEPSRQLTFVGDGSLKGNNITYDTGTFRVASQKNRAGLPYTFGGFNALNLPTTASTPVGDATFGYDLQGRLISISATHAHGEDAHFQFQRDALDRIRQATYGPNGNYNAIYTFDNFGPLTSAQFKEALGTFTVSSTLNTDGTRKSLSYPSTAVQLNEGRDGAGRLNTISSSAGTLYAVVDRQGATQPADVSLGDGLITEHTEYNNRRLLLSRRYEHAGNLLADVRYQYDLSDNRQVRQEVHRHGRADLFQYDSDNRLTRADMGARPAVDGSVRNGTTGLQPAFGFAAGLFARTYSYDATGLDLLAGSIPIDPDAALLPPLLPFAQTLMNQDPMLFPQQVDGTIRPPADGLGNAVGTTLFIRPDTGADPVPVRATLKHNGVSQLVSITYSDQGTPVLIEYEHQPGGLIHHRKVTRGTTIVSDRAWVYDGNLLLEEFENAGGTTAVAARYYYADEDCPFAADLADSSGNLQRYYYLRDAQGSVMALADASGQVVERVSYDPWGQPAIQSRDTLPPRVSMVLRDGNNDLLVLFTERVMPPLSGAGQGTALVTGTVGVTGALGLQGAGGVVPATLAYEENPTNQLLATLAGANAFAAVIRVTAQSDPGSNVVLQINGGSLVDEWGLTNLSEQISFSLAGTNAVLFQGPAPGSTAPPRLARSGLGNAFLFHGQFFDYDAGLLYLRARFYDPYTGSFLEHDPVGYEDSVNLYAGFGNNPTSKRDPTGLANQPRGSGPSGGGGNRMVGASPGSRRTVRTHPDPDATIPDGTPVDPNKTVIQPRHPAPTDSTVDNVTAIHPPPGHQPSDQFQKQLLKDMAPPPRSTEFVFRGLHMTPEAAADFEISELRQGVLLSGTRRAAKPIPDGVATHEVLRDSEERIANGDGREGFTSEEMGRMTGDQLLAAAHIGAAKVGGELLGISTAKLPRQEQGGSLDFALRYANPGEDSYLLVLEVQRGSGVREFEGRPMNADEGNEVTFLFELNFVSAKLYKVIDGLGGLEFQHLGTFPGRR